MNQDEKRKLENQLMVEGLSGLNDPELIQQFANLIDNWPGDKHEFMRDALNECDADKRYDMYQALVPKIRSFKPLTYSQYESQIALKAGAMVSQGRMRVEGDKPRPVEVGDRQAIPTAADLAAKAKLLCFGCGKIEQFLGATPVAAITNARRAGWVKQPGFDREYCPKCSAELAHEETVTLAQNQHLVVNDRRRVN